MPDETTPRRKRLDCGFALKGGVDPLEGDEVGGWRFAGYFSV